MFVEEKRTGEAPVREKKSGETPRGHLLKAADYIEEHGWCRHNYSNPLGEVCLVGALMAVADTALQDAANNPCAIRAIRQNANAGYRLLEDHLKISPSYWNDYVCKNKEEVVGLLRKIANRKCKTKNQ